MSTDHCPSRQDSGGGERSAEMSDNGVNNGEPDNGYLNTVSISHRAVTGQGNRYTDHLTQTLPLGVITDQWLVVVSLPCLGQLSVCECQ
ncbi:hypothetical protein RRG08_001064 [Elysia crispata]|uniref:Uncharacterized protein n=1 Tax=Elysia crispata TaxID=231223 RepID=A0AAE1AX19_9GAST|nr:hypothetical protein RRG08_001064 [Elysia crispata]